MMPTPYTPGLSITWPSVTKLAFVVPEKIHSMDWPAVPDWRAMAVEDSSVKLPAIWVPITSRMVVVP